jgi:hypothetical protein
MAAPPPRWTAAEIDYLSELAGLPVILLARRFQRRARAQGWPPRTAKAIHIKLGKLGLAGHGRSRTRADDLVSSGGAAQILGCPSDRVSRWMEEPALLPILRPVWGGHRRYVSREGWRRLARQRPDVLGGFGADRLFELLEDRELADAVAAAHPYQRTDYRIRCVETGRIWANATAAARELFISHSAIGLAIAEGRAVASLGLRFERLRGAAI